MSEDTTPIQLTADQAQSLIRTLARIDLAWSHVVGDVPIMANLSLYTGRFRCWDAAGNSSPVVEIEANTAEEAARKLMDQWCDDAPDIEAAMISIQDGGIDRTFSCTPSGSVIEIGVMSST